LKNSETPGHKLDKSAWKNWTLQKKSSLKQALRFGIAKKLEQEMEAGNLDKQGFEAALKKLNKQPATQE